jgi:hypothetical protein
MKAEAERALQTPDEYPRHDYRDVVRVRERRAKARL